VSTPQEGRQASSEARPWLLAGGLCAAVLAVDQVAKAVVENRLVPGEKVDVLGPLGITLAHNEGVAFGLASGSAAPLIVFAALALAFVGFLLARNPTAPGMWIAVGLVAGGALGNLVDRLRVGEVTDYIEIGSWPPFNVADIAITLGVLGFALIFLREDAR
jgi:signal peptidase II